jgi:hypothetical protein
LRIRHQESQSQASLGFGFSTFKCICFLVLTNFLCIMF